MAVLQEKQLFVIFGILRLIRNRQCRIRLKEKLTQVLIFSNPHMYRPMCPHRSMILWLWFCEEEI